MKKRIDFDSGLIKTFIKQFVHAGFYLYEDRSKTKRSDKGNQVFYDLFKEEQKYREVILITGNIKDFPKEKGIVTPKEAIERIEIV